MRAIARMTAVVLLGVYTAWVAWIGWMFGHAAGEREREDRAP